MAVVEKSCADVHWCFTVKLYWMSTGSGTISALQIHKSTLKYLCRSMSLLFIFKIVLLHPDCCISFLPTFALLFQLFSCLPLVFSWVNCCCLLIFCWWHLVKSEYWLSEEYHSLPVLGHGPLCTADMRYLTNKLDCALQPASLFFIRLLKLCNHLQTKNLLQLA